MAGTTTFNAMPIELFLKQQLDVFKIESDTVPDYVAQFFAESATDLYRTTYLSRPGLGNFNTWTQEDVSDVESLDTGYETTLQQSAWRKLVAYTYKMKKYLQYREVITDLAKGLAVSGKRTKNTHGMAWVNAQLFGSGTVWNATENKYLFSATHPLKDGSTFQNLYTAPLSVSSLAIACTKLRMTPDERGGIMGFSPKELWVYTEDYDNAVQVVNAGIAYESGKANFTKNVLDIGLKIIPCEFMTDNSWIVKDTSAKCKLKSLVSETLNSRQYGRDSDRATIHDAQFAFAVGAADWRGLVGSTGVG